MFVLLFYSRCLMRRFDCKFGCCLSSCNFWTYGPALNTFMVPNAKVKPTNEQMLHIKHTMANLLAVFPAFGVKALHRTLYHHPHTYTDAALDPQIN